jgi:hypothetical protein
MPIRQCILANLVTGCVVVLLTASNVWAGQWARQLLEQVPRLEARNASEAPLLVAR